MHAATSLLQILLIADGPRAAPLPPSQGSQHPTPRMLGRAAESDMSPAHATDWDDETEADCDDA